MNDSRSQPLLNAGVTRVPSVTEQLTLIVSIECKHEICHTRRHTPPG